MKAKALFSVAFVALFASCTNDVVVSEKADTPIRITTSLDKHTRAGYTQAADITEFKMSAFKTGTNTLWINNVDVTNSSGSYSWSGNTVWPGDGSGLTFVAYAPKTLSNGTPSLSHNSSTITGFEQSTTDPTDLITAYADVANGSSVTLNFKHALSKVEVQAVNESTLDYTIDIKGIRIGGVNKKGDLAWQTTPSGLPTWSNQTDKDKFSYEGTTEVTNPTTAQSIMFDKEFYMIPQTLTAWDPTNDGNNTTNGSYLSVYCCIKNNGVNVFPTSTGFAWAAIPINGEWKAGYKYIYTLKFFAGGTGGAGYVDPGDTGGGTVIIQNTDINISVTIDSWTTDSSSSVNLSY